MARESGRLWAPLPYAYQVVPTRQLHSTMDSIFSRLDKEAFSKDEGLMFDSDATRKKADITLHVAHLILLTVLNIQKECFKIAELEPLLDTRIQDTSAERLDLLTTEPIRRSECDTASSAYFAGNRRGR